MKNKENIISDLENKIKTQEKIINKLIEMGNFPARIYTHTRQGLLPGLERSVTTVDYVYRGTLKSAIIEELSLHNKIIKETLTTIIVRIGSKYYKIDKDNNNIMNITDVYKEESKEDSFYVEYLKKI